MLRLSLVYMKKEREAEIKGLNFLIFIFLRFVCLCRGEIMGNIYTRDIKRITMELYEKYKNEISTDFEQNKQIVAKYVDVYSKKIRNRIAGYLTRYAKRMKSSKVETTEEVVEEE